MASNEVLIVSGPPRVSREALLRALREYLAGSAVERAVVFGSFARGDADEASDLDLMLVEPTERPPLERGLAHLPLFRLGVGVDLLVYTPEEHALLAAQHHPLIERIESEGITIHARSGD